VIRRIVEGGEKGATAVMNSAVTVTKGICEDRP
jgi:hypothetical protein